MLRTLLDATGCDYELILLKDKNIRPCSGCGGCYFAHKCIVKDDMQGIYKKLEKADAIVLGSPTYFANVTSLMKSFIDRCLPLYLSEKLKGKKVALVTVGNFKKEEVRYLDNFDPEVAVKTPEGRKSLRKTIKRCMDIMKDFCTHHMKMNLVGSVIALYGGQPELKKNELIKLGKKIAKSL